MVDAVWSQVIGHDLSIRELFAQPDDQKLVSTLTLLAIVAADLGDDWAPTVAKANRLLDRAELQGLPRCPATKRLLAFED